MKNLFLIILISIFIFGCKKETVTPKTPDSVANPTTDTTNINTTCLNQFADPGIYFPAHPSSWWDYIQLTNTNKLYTIDSTLTLFDDICHPKFNNADRLVSGSTIIQSIYSGLGQSWYDYSPIYSETLNDTLLCSFSFSTFNYYEFMASGTPPIRRVVLATDTTITTLLSTTTFSQVLMIKEYDLNDTTHYYYDYFSKDIGLVKRDSIHISDETNLIEILALDSYYINN